MTFLTFAEIRRAVGDARRGGVAAASNNTRALSTCFKTSTLVCHSTV